MAASFAKLLRHSKLVQLGDFNGRILVGRVVHRVNEDLYIDFGLKFNAICKRPLNESEKYVIGTKVLIKLIDPELSERFLGSKHDLTLLEADAKLIGLFRERTQKRSRHMGTEEETENQSNFLNDNQVDPSIISHG